MLYNLYIRTQKLADLGQVHQIYQQSTWSKSAHNIYSKKGRHLSAEKLTVQSVPEHHTIRVPISHLLPAQSDMNLQGKMRSKFVKFDNYNFSMI